MKKEKNSKQETAKPRLNKSKKNFNQRLYEKYPHISRAIFWLTCWRPVTKYELANMAKSIIIFANTNYREHTKMMKNIDEIMKIYQYNKVEDKKEAEERGVYG